MIPVGRQRKPRCRIGPQREQHDQQHAADLAALDLPCADIHCAPPWSAAVRAISLSGRDHHVAGAHAPAEPGRTGAAAWNAGHSNSRPLRLAGLVGQHVEQPHRPGRRPAASSTGSSSPPPAAAAAAGAAETSGTAPSAWVRPRHRHAHKPAARAPRSAPGSAKFAASRIRLQRSGRSRHSSIRQA